MSEQMKEALEKYKGKIVDDYHSWSCVKKTPIEDNPRVLEFKKGLEMKETRHYFKFLTANGSSKSVHSFIVKEDKVIRGKEWKKGVILMAASFQSPALNFIRGNIFKDYEIRWVGTAI